MQFARFRQQSSASWLAEGRYARCLPGERCSPNERGADRSPGKQRRGRPRAGRLRRRPAGWPAPL